MKKYRILFVCLGNICRSPMAECIMKQLVKKQNEEDSFFIDSAGILSYHQGENSDKRMREQAHIRGYFLSHKSRPINANDFDFFDIIIGMDDNNIDDLLEQSPSLEGTKKIHKMAEFFSQNINIDHVPDPYYGGHDGFNYVINLLEDGCQNLFSYLKEKI